MTTTSEVRPAEPPYRAAEAEPRPTRVLVLALLAVGALVAGADRLSAALWDLSEHRYAHEVFAALL